MYKLLILNGPNLNLLGMREPGHYGNESLGDINVALEKVAGAADAKLFTFQSNAEQ
jgi:3-dehydroquinate dehydratase-2